MDTESPPECEQPSPRPPPRAANKHVLEVVHVLAIEASIMQMPKPTPWLMMVLCALLTTAFYFFIVHYFAQGSIWLALASGATVSLLVLWWPIHLERYASLARKRLPGSGIAQTIAGGPQELAKIYDHTPWPWSIYLLGPKPRDLRGWIRLVARNLDWYLAEPRLLVRYEWLFGVLGWAVFYLLMLLRIVTSAPLGGPRGPLLFGLLILLPAAMLVGMGSQKRMLSAMLLRDHLRERFADDLAAAEEAD